MSRRIAIGAVLGLALALAPAAGLAQAYQPQRVAVPKAAGYLRPDGSVYVVGNDSLAELFEKLNAAFVRSHPGVRFTMNMNGSSTGIGGLVAGVSAFAPMGRDAWPGDLSAFKDTFGYEPLDVHIGYLDYTRPGAKSPPAIYVNAANPIAGLTVEEVERIFTSGNPNGDLTRWEQLGVGGKWKARTIHLYGGRDDGTLATSLRERLMGGRPFARRYEPQDKAADIVQAVADDPYGVGLVGFFDPQSVPGVKIAPLARHAGEPFVRPSYDDQHAGRYPMASLIRIYANRAPGKPLDPFVKEYLRFVLSPQGQAIVASFRDAEEGLVPLDAAAAAAERAKLD